MRERYGIEPEQVTDLIALRGDPSDNIPGARGIGQKTAAELLRRYGDLEGVIAHAAELTPRQRLAVEGSADDLRRYLEVAAMRRDVADDDPGRRRRWPRSPRRSGAAEAGMLGLASAARRLSAALECLRAMEPDSLLVRGLVDNASGGLSPALDRSTTFEREPGGGSPYGRGHAPVAAEAEALLGALEDAEATVFASGMTAWTCICLTVLGRGQRAGAADERLLQPRGLRVGILRALRRRGAALRRPRPRRTSAAPATAPRSRSSRRRPTRC